MCVLASRHLCLGWNTSVSWPADMRVDVHLSPIDLTKYLMSKIFDKIFTSLIERLSPIPTELMDGFLAILRRFDGGFLLIPHELIEIFLLIPHGFDERVAIIPFEIDGGIGFDGGVLIYSLQSIDGGIPIHSRGSC